MNIHEFQAKQLLARFGVAVPAGGPAVTPSEARAQAAKLFAAGHTCVAVKSQIHAGGRGKGVFRSGGLSGVKMCANADEVFAAAQAMLGNVLVTKQTGPAGRQVTKLLIEAAIAVKNEFYCAVLLDRVTAQPLALVSTSGGMDIEEVAAQNPERIIKEWIDPAIGMMPFQARKLAAGLGLKGGLFKAGTELLLGVYMAWWECDALLVEINPLCIGTDLKGRECLTALDAKMVIDDNSLFRQSEISAMRDIAEESPLETEATQYGLSYVKLDGNIACLVNGAGLAMATMDIIKYYGGEPANFLDVGGGASVDQVVAAFRIISKDTNARVILVNIFGGIMDCEVIARGIVTAAKETGLTLPLVVRLEGNNALVGKCVLADAGIPVISANSMGDAAEKAVRIAGG